MLISYSFLLHIKMLDRKSTITIQILLWNFFEFKTCYDGVRLNFLPTYHISLISFIDKYPLLVKKIMTRTIVLYFWSNTYLFIQCLWMILDTVKWGKSYSKFDGWTKLNNCIHIWSTSMPYINCNVFLWIISYLLRKIR